MNLIDWEQLDMIADGFTPDFLDIYREFLEETPSLFLQLRHQLTSNNAGEASKVAHQIKGSAANFGFVGVSQPMAKIEIDAKSGTLLNAATWLAEAERSFQEAALEVKAKRLS